MNWKIPAKTFFLGEYAAVAQEPAILLTTTPSFMLTLKEEPGLEGIHKNAPAGLFWQDKNMRHGLKFHDPYQTAGGLGACG